METAHYVVSYGNLFGGHWWGRGRTGLTDAGALSPPGSPSAQHEAISVISLVIFGSPALNLLRSQLMSLLMRDGWRKMSLSRVDSWRSNLVFFLGWRSTEGPSWNSSGSCCSGLRMGGQAERWRAGGRSSISSRRRRPITRARQRRRRAVCAAVRPRLT